MLRRTFLLAWLVLLAIAPRATAATMTEYFDYGSYPDDAGTTRTLPGQNSGSGWPGSWTGTTDTNTPRSLQGQSMSYSGTGYQNADNNLSASGGAARGINDTAFAHRATGGLAGTIWISALVKQTTASSGRLILWMDGDNASLTGTNGTGNNYAQLQNGAYGVRYNGSVNSANTASGLASGQVGLFLLKLEVNAAGANDRISFWFNPDLSLGEVGLSAPNYTNVGADALGNSLVNMRLSGSGTNAVLIDSLRISNEANGFQFVTTGAVPEPSSFAIAGFAALAGSGLWIRRHRRSK